MSENPTMKTKAIGVFDSGLGGLTAVKELEKLMPNEKIIYFGDTARVPYGTRSKKVITEFALEALDFLLKHDLKAVLAACGTISSVAMPVLKDKSTVFITGVVEPTARAAVNATKNGKIAVLGTGATVSSRSYENEIHLLNKDIKVFATACPLFVPLVENGYFDRNNKPTRLVAEDYLLPVKATGADTVILGCTHYPLLREIIADIMGENVALIDSGSEAARDICSFLTSKELMNDSKTIPEKHFYVSDQVDNFSTLAQIFLGHKIEAEYVKIEGN